MLRVAPGFLSTPDSIYQFSPTLHTCRCNQGLLDHTSPRGSNRWTGHLCSKSSRKYFVRVGAFIVILGDPLLLTAPGSPRMFHSMLGDSVALLSKFRPDNICNVLRMSNRPFPHSTSVRKSSGTRMTLGSRHFRTFPAFLSTGPWPRFYAIHSIVCWNAGKVYIWFVKRSERSICTYFFHIITSTYFFHIITSISLNKTPDNGKQPWPQLVETPRACGQSPGERIWPRLELEGLRMKWPRGNGVEGEAFLFLPSAFSSILFLYSFSSPHPLLESPFPA